MPGYVALDDDRLPTHTLNDSTVLLLLQPGTRTKPLMCTPCDGMPGEEGGGGRRGG
jgi:hypothetical protein